MKRIFSNHIPTVPVAVSKLTRLKYMNANCKAKPWNWKNQQKFISYISDLGPNSLTTFPPGLTYMTKLTLVHKEMEETTKYNKQTSPKQFTPSFIIETIPWYFFSFGEKSNSDHSWYSEGTNKLALPGFETYTSLLTQANWHHNFISQTSIVMESSQSPKAYRNVVLYRHCNTNKSQQ